MFTRRRISPKVRFEVLKRDNHTCRYCGARPPGVVLHIDHVEPIARGGRNDMENLAVACSACNAGKGACPLGDRSAFAGQLSLPMATRVQTRPRHRRFNR